MRALERALHSLGGRRVLVPVLLFAAVVLLFLPAARFDFTNWDDDSYILHNPLVRQPGASSAFGALTSTWEGFYGPVTWWAFRLQYTLFGPNASGFHAVGILLHGINAVLVFVLLGRVGFPAGAALVGALLWAVHPLRVEAVAWVTAQKDLLSTMLCLVSGILYLRSRERAADQQGRRKPDRDLLAAYGVFFLALAAKPTVAPWALMLYLFDLARRPPAADRPKLRQCTARLLPVLPMLICAVPFAVFMALSLMRMGSLESHHVRLPGRTLLLSAYCLQFHVGHTLLPLGLSAFYVLPEPVHVTTPAFALALAGSAICIVLVALLAGRWPWAAVGAAAFVAGLLPVLQLVPAGQLAADRYTYLPSVGVAVMVAAGFRFLAARCYTRWRIRMLLAAFALMLAVCGRLSVARLPVWRNSVSLWTDALADGSRSWVVRAKLGQALLQAGRINDAVPHLHYAGLRAADQFWLHRDLARALVSLEQKGRAFAVCFRWAQYLMHSGRCPVEVRTGLEDLCSEVGLEPQPAGRAFDKYAEAASAFSAGRSGRAVEVLLPLCRKHPELPDARLLLFHACLAAGDVEAAAANLDAWERLTGEKAIACRMRARLSAARGDVQGAVALCRERLAAEPDPQLMSTLGLLLCRTGDGLAEADRLTRRACRLRPEDPALARARAWVLHRRGDTCRAFDLLESHPPHSTADPEELYRCGMIWAAAGHRIKASESLRSAVERAPPGAHWLNQAQEALKEMPGP